MAGTFAAHCGRPRSLRALLFFVLGVTFAISLSGSPDAFAAEPDPGKDIASIRDWLYTNNPQLRALQADADAYVAAAQACKDFAPVPAAAE